ncbi:methyltransferase domain-containing protein [Muricauda sp. JGD-17]|uniref:Methyltransferase domain-containing protein n=1 Tax=Flagellimonas ochracea TaxID=2696472 RepID=A0A964WYK3_9FLAO|nr:class I SAM-dependent methyltransferase [Allomuricauda ochracea]NAY92992.1 methyltransferase domain-containing protein [Allomuricauda ochracea]
MEDVFGKALMDYHLGNYTEDILTFSSLDEEDAIPLPYLFRNFEAMPLLEQKAMEMARGSVLDIGCGAGNHALYLQEKGMKVTALDSSAGAIEVCKKRGVINPINQTLLEYKEEKFDTLLLLMNGVGLAGTLDHLNVFLRHLTSLLKPNGQILLDSSDIIYMFNQDDDGGYWIPSNGNYYGEVTFVMRYKGNKTAPFPWLYIDYNTLQNACAANNLSCELVLLGPHYDYLAKLSLKEY